mmetsp:Transcript_100047/g.287423  ORF Transcript_100047/g.287423 Transcript_100047/m.287423 type:complete len:222 (-) Transcript_100047:215-880(-)
MRSPTQHGANPHLRSGVGLQPEGSGPHLRSVNRVREQCRADERELRHFPHAVVPVIERDLRYLRFHDALHRSLPQSLERGSVVPLRRGGCSSHRAPSRRGSGRHAEQHRCPSGHAGNRCPDILRPLELHCRRHPATCAQFCPAGPSPPVGPRAEDREVQKCDDRSRGDGQPSHVSDASVGSEGAGGLSLRGGVRLEACRCGRRGAVEQWQRWVYRRRRRRA